MILQSTFRAPVLGYQRHRQRIDDALLAMLLALLVGIFLEGMGVFPGQWQTAILLAIFGLGVQARAWGYYAAVVALLWPLWLLSPYLMTLFLAVVLLPREWIIEGLPWALLVAAAPLLAEWQLLALAPLLAGLLGGASAGLWTGVFAALWLKLAGGLAGWLPEIGALYGASFSVALIREQVADANSLETLLLLAEPFAQSSFLLLLHALQIVAWGLGGWIVGKVQALEWRGSEPRFPLVLALAPGTLLLWAAIYLLPAWLELEPTGRFLAEPLPTVGIAVAAMASALWATLYRSMQHPLSRTAPHVAAARRERAGAVGERDTSHTRPTTHAEEDDLIMLELD